MESTKQFLNAADWLLDWDLTNFAQKNCEPKMLGNMGGLLSQTKQKMCFCKFSHAENWKIWNHSILF